MNTIKQGDMVVCYPFGIGKVIDVFVTGIALVSFKHSERIVSIKTLHKASKIINKGEKDA
jgi:hypothetical protein